MLGGLCVKETSQKLRFLMIHNSYQNRGGEEALFETERQVLLSQGHEVVEYRRHNDEIRAYTSFRKLALPAKTVWAWDSYAEVRKICQEKRPQAAILFNTLPLISPSVVHACSNAGVPLLQHYQNYRLVCSAGIFFRDGKACQECLDRGMWSGIRHGCYRGSRLATSVVTAQTMVHRLANTWNQKVTGFIAPSMFIRDIAIRGGLPAERIHLKPNCMEPDPGKRSSFEDFALYAGRLSPEKGIRTLISAWSEMTEEIPLRIAGDGPLRGELEDAVKSNGIRNVTFLGSLPHGELVSLMKKTRLLIFPTECYEGFPMTIVEGLACGAPILASRIGAAQELLEEDRTGFFFMPGDRESLAAQAQKIWKMGEQVERISGWARKEYELKYTGQRNHTRLMEILQSLGVDTKTQALVPAPRLSRISA
jgi:glycosyltransferase involved in cell wall biosynthesis